MTTNLTLEDLRVAAEIGAEMADSSNGETVVRARLTALSMQAHDVLGVLRVIRDGCPDEWDAITKSEHGIRLMDLWDDLRELERNLFADDSEPLNPRFVEAVNRAGEAEHAKQS